MAPPRRRQGNNNATSTNQQSTLSFGGTQSRITKPTNAPAKDAKLNSSKTSSPSPVVTSLQTTTSSPKFTTAKDLLKKTREGYTIPPASASTSPTSESGKEESVEEPEPTTTTTTLPHHPSKPTASSKPLTPLESHALSLPPSALQSYWSSIESSRKAPRVHQESTPLPEKILRHFDLCSEFGPCVGLTRMERWKRAEMLGLGPRVEVLSVLLRQERGEGERSRFDELLQ
ncbi:hypothetical protein FQN54_006703 [Arachnomyces sp. PD_36]|nr:hypothetical protein FQN54_006703 [Arachnomyces sp. PD_36]